MNESKNEGQCWSEPRSVGFKVAASMDNQVVADDIGSVAMETVMLVLRNILWNLYQFYSQFSDIVRSELERLRTPIEKELKVNSIPVYICL